MNGGVASASEPIFFHRGGRGGGEMASICVPPGILRLNHHQVAVVVVGGGRGGGGGVGAHHHQRRLRQILSSSSAAAADAASILTPNNNSAIPFTLPRTCSYELTTRWHTRQRIFTTFASNSNPSGGDSIKDKSEKITTRDGAQGPPFLTILAGLLVFLLVCWVFGSIVLWLCGLIIKVPR